MSSTAAVVPSDSAIDPSMRTALTELPSLASCDQPSTAGQGLASELTRKSFQNASIKIGIFSNAQLYKLVFQDGHLGLSHGINYLLPQQFLQSLISAVLCVPNFGL